MLTLSSQQRRGVTEEWLGLTLRSYPAQSMRFLLYGTDSLRNPMA